MSRKVINKYYTPTHTYVHGKSVNCIDDFEQIFEQELIQTSKLLLLYIYHRRKRFLGACESLADSRQQRVQKLADIKRQTRHRRVEVQSQSPSPEVGDLAIWVMAATRSVFGDLCSNFSPPEFALSRGIRTGKARAYAENSPSHLPVPFQPHPPAPFISRRRISTHLFIFIYFSVSARVDI